jgi:hypothetical protein
MDGRDGGSPNCTGKVRSWRCRVGYQSEVAVLAPARGSASLECQKVVS